MVFSRQTARKAVFANERIRFTLVLLLIAQALSWLPVVQRLDYQIYDMLLQLKPVYSPQSTVIVAIDEKSLAALGRWPWPRETHGRLIKKLQALTSDPIVFDVILAESMGADDHSMIAAMREQANIWLPLHLQSIDGQLLEFLPAAEFLAAARGIGHAHLPLDPDGIVRNIRLLEGDAASPWPALALAVANATQNEPEIRARAALTDDRMLGIPFMGNAGTIPTFSYIDVLNGRIPESLLQGKTLFVGATAAGLGDFLATPFSGEASPMPGVEIHATIYEGIVADRLIRSLEAWWRTLFLLMFVLSTALLFPRVPPQLNWPLTLLILGGILGSSLLLLFLRQVWCAPGVSLLTIMLAYPIWSWRRFRSMTRFLNSEIQRLASEPGLDKLIPNDTLQQWAQQVVLFLRPDRWELLRKSDPDLVAAAQKVTKTCEPDGWRFNCLLPGPGRPALQLLFNKERTDVDAICRYMENLPLPSLDESAQYRRRHELIERRIRQVSKAISSLQTMRRFVSETLERMPDGILIGDELGRLFYCNESGRRWLETPPAKGATIASLLALHHNGQDTAAWNDAIRDAIVKGVSSSRTWADRNMAGIVLIAPLTLGLKGNQGVIVTLSDISAIHQAQMERLQTINFISHDLRSPLSSQMALLEKARREQSGNAETSALVEKLQGLTRKSLTLADDFLQLARVEAQSDINLYACSLQDIVDNALDTAAPQAAQKNIDLSVSEAEEAFYVRANADLLERALGNLLSNAIKFAPGDSIVKLVTSRRGQFIRLSLTDSGPGICESELPRLFESFRRTRQSDELHKPGSGLGLKFVKTVMLRFGGTVGVESKSGAGSTFWLDLPACPDQADQPELPL